MSEDILQAIKETVETAVDEKINGKLRGLKEDNKKITEHLEDQDKNILEQGKVLDEVKDLLKERRFIIQLWAFVKVVGGIIVSIGGAILLFKNLK